MQRVVEEKNDRSTIETAIDKAALFLPDGFFPRHMHSERCYNMLKHILYDSEYTVIEAKQSLWKSFAPMRILATNQRVIIVKPSFWSLWTGQNVFSPTKYESIPYSNIINITFSAGMIFSSLCVHLNIGVLNNDEGEVDGLKTRDAKAIFTFLEKMTEYIRGDGKETSENAVAEKQTQRSGNSNYLDLKTSREMVRNMNSKFVWLGVEPLDYAAEKLQVDRGDMIKVNIGGLMQMEKKQAESLKNHVLVCYNGNFSTYVSKYLKEVYGINTYVLPGGMGRYGKTRISGISKFGFKDPANIL